MAEFSDEEERERNIENLAQDLLRISASEEEGELCLSWWRTEVPRLPCSIIERIHALRLARRAIEKAGEAVLLHPAPRKP